MMKKILLVITMLLVNTQVLAKSSPVGLWKTIDDVTGQPKAIVEIWETKEKTLYGKVRKIFHTTDANNLICKDCPGEKRNQHIVGLTILENLKPNAKKEDEWQNGAILDPKNGKTYHCNIRLAGNGQKLQVRGYVGLPLFGRTQTWQKISNSEVA